MMPEAVGYTRISMQDQSNNSLNDQAIVITEYCKANNLTLTKIFTDNGKSAFTFDRPEWKLLEKYIRENKSIKYLVIKHIDRFSRATLMDALVKLHEIEEKLKVKVLTVSDRVDQNSNELGVQMLRTMNLIFSNNERNRIQERVKDGIYRSYSEGRYCGMAPYGYKNSRDKNGKPLIQIHEEKAAHIRKIFSLYKQGLNPEAIRNEVIKDGFNQKGNSAIQNILSNPLYAGILVLPAYKGQPSREVNALHEPIISKVDFYTVQPNINKRTATTQLSEEVWLRGIVHCHCGRKMTAGNSRGQHGKYYWYYKCSEHRKDYSATKLHGQFKEILEVISFSKSSIEFYQANLMSKIEEYQNKKGGNIMRLKLALQKVQKKIEDTQTRYLLNPGIVEPYIYSKAMTELRSDESRLATDLSKTKTDTDTMVAMAKELLPKLSQLSEVFCNWPLFRQQLFIKVVFSDALSYFEGFYRTPFIHPMFADKALILKQKGLLIIGQPSAEFNKLRLGTPEGSCSEPLDSLEQLYRVFVA